MLDKSIPHRGVLMVKKNAADYPRYDLPEGFSFCGYRSGLEKDWAKLMFSVEQTDSLEEAEDIFKREFLSEPGLLAERCLFVLDEKGAVAAAASLWHGSHFGKKLPRIHWVAAAPEHQGKGLVKALLTRLLDVYNEKENDGFLYLTTQTWSYKAVHLYLKFGFEPYFGPKPVNWKSEHFDEENKTAWDMIWEKIREYKG